MLSINILRLSLAGLVTANGLVDSFPRLAGVIRDDSANYECHADCGYALLISQETSDYCTNSTFVSDYDGCLECAGPDDQNIWQYYGTDLAAAGSECGFVTTPDSGSATSVAASSATSSASSVPVSVSATVTSVPSSAAVYSVASTSSVPTVSSVTYYSSAAASATTSVKSNSTTSAAVTQYTGGADRVLPTFLKFAAVIGFAVALA